MSWCNDRLASKPVDGSPRLQPRPHRGGGQREEGPPTGGARMGGGGSQRDTSARRAQSRQREPERGSSEVAWGGHGEGGNLALGHEILLAECPVVAVLVARSGKSVRG